MALEDRTIASSQVSVEIRNLLNQFDRQKLVVIEVDEAFEEEVLNLNLKLNDSIFVVRQDDETKLIYGPLKEEEIYFSDSTSEEKGKRIIAYSPKLEVFLKEIATHVLSPPSLITKYDKGLNIINLDWKNIEKDELFAKRFVKSGRTIFTYFDGALDLIIGPIDEKKLYLHPDSR
jgi:hypothetical protein